MCVCTHTHIYIHIYLYNYMCVCVCVGNDVGWCVSFHIMCITWESLSCLLISSDTRHRIIVMLRVVLLSDSEGCYESYRVITFSSGFWRWNLIQSHSVWLQTLVFSFKCPTMWRTLAIVSLHFFLSLTLCINILFSFRNHIFKPSRCLTPCLPLLFFPLIMPIVMMFSNPSLLMTCPKNLASLSLSDFNT